jgi:guanylate kinase
LRNAPTELQDYSAFEYVIINDELDRAAEQMTAIIHAERARLSRQGHRIKSVVEAFTTTESGLPLAAENEVAGKSSN